MIEKVPFTRYKLDEEKAEETGKVFSIRLNDEELKQLQAVMETLNVSAESKALKACFYAGANVIHDTFPAKFWRYLIKRDRKKYGS